MVGGHVGGGGHGGQNVGVLRLGGGRGGSSGTGTCHILTPLPAHLALQWASWICTSCVVVTDLRIGMAGALLGVRGNYVLQSPPTLHWIPYRLWFRIRLPIVSCNIYTHMYTRAVISIPDIEINVS